MRLIPSAPHPTPHPRLHPAGCGGGSQLTHNVLFNFCRESSDHGPFNMWNRVVYLVDGPDGKPTTAKQNETIAYNWILANYHSSMAIDTDDGSAYLDVHENVLISASSGAAYGGDSLKCACVMLPTAPCRAGRVAPGGPRLRGRPRPSPHPPHPPHPPPPPPRRRPCPLSHPAPLTHPPHAADFGGHDNFHWGNLDLFWSQGFGICQQVAGHGDGYYSNYLWLAADGNYGGGQTCSGAGQTIVFNNTIWSPTGKITECGTSLAQWQAAGNDPGTTGSPYPADGTVLGLARTILGMPPA
jgi:hypothetical protein